MRTIFFVLTLLIVGLCMSCRDRERREQALRDLDQAQQLLDDIQKKISEYELALAQNQTELEVARDNLQQAKEFQFLRTEEERAEEIRSATAYKLSIEKNILDLRGTITSCKDSVATTSYRIAQLKEILKH